MTENETVTIDCGDCKIEMDRTEHDNFLKWLLREDGDE